MPYDIFGDEDDKAGVLPFEYTFTEQEALKGMFEIAIETGEEMLEDPTPLNAGLLRKTIEIMTSEVSRSTLNDLDISGRKEWRLLSDFARGKPTPVEKIIEACASLLPLVEE